MYSQVCIIEVNLSHLANVQENKRRGLKGTYYRLDYDVVLLFGLTEFKAQLVWKEKVMCVIFHVTQPCISDISQGVEKRYQTDFLLFFNN